MTMNPFLEKPMNLQDFQNWNQIYPKPYHKNEVNPYTKTRVILMNGTEFEANWFSHQFDRHCDNNDLRREFGGGAPDGKTTANENFCSKTRRRIYFGAYHLL